MQIKTKKAFSLMEILIVMALMSIMLVVVISTKNTDSSGKEVEAAAQQIVAQLRTLQNESLNGKQFSNVPVGVFKFHAENTSYTVSYINGGSILNSFVVNLSKVNVVAAADIIFNSPRGENSGQNAILIRSRKNTSLEYVICVSSNGNIKTIKGAICN